MVNTSSAVPFTFEASSYSHFLGIEQTETAMICWLQKQEHDTLPDSLFATASVLFGWIDSHDLIALLDVSLREVAIQLEREHDFGNTLDDSDASRIPFGSPRAEAVHFYEYLTGPNDRFLSLPRLLKTWVDNTTYCAYIIASLAEFKPSCNRDSFKTKECKSLAILKSDLHMLGLKKQRAQVEVDMLSEAIARMSEFEHTDDGISSGSSMTCVSRPPETSVGSFDDWLSSYASSDISSVM
ncbi:uncharacterized protein F5891DRAFT_1189636 [Suillus fuscotomentosus]|uniref:Uncharacterized protein n=1 Tax=Suillus fuscotomentosus TaxID=1912939 RepID=A0AAD4HK57_9AGAM|nr:uncharacterized protein F5891DRAFT_1189636 [Suillus fuscotomentosus]KAG1899502.1 hypothetical protein F5891DRAFT_1189636 [Suillus fuscotomentosus]